MKTTETCVAHVEPTAAEKLEAPISLTPDQLQAVSGGSWRLPGTITGLRIWHWEPAKHDPPGLPTILGVVPRHWPI